MQTPPDGLRPGEQTLRFLQKPTFGPLRAVNLFSQHLMLALVVGCLGTGVLACGGAMAGPAVGGWLALFGLAVTLVGGTVYAARRTRLPGLWLVTTERVLYTVGKEVVQVPLADVTEVDADASMASLTLKTAGQTHLIAPVDALPELWGAVWLGRAWRPGPFEVEPAFTVKPVVAWWGTAKQGVTATRGVLVLRPDYVAWLPEQVTRSVGDVAGLAALVVGVQIRRVSALPPLVRVLSLLQCLRDPDSYDARLAELIARWSGWRRPIADVRPTVTPGRKGANVSLVVDGVTYEAPAVAHADWAAVEAAWKATA